MIRFTLRLTKTTHKEVERRARKGKVSMNQQIENELSKRRWSDEDMIEWQIRFSNLKPNPPYVLENIQRQVNREWEQFKKERL
jgi:16S rRNA U516 pseudouridylate synthase RsuA-like enzyme